MSRYFGREKAEGLRFLMEESGFEGPGDKKGVHNEIPQILGDSWSDGNAAADVFTGAGQGWNWRWGWPGLRGRSAGLFLRLLLVLSVRVCALRVLRPKLVFEWSVHRRRPVVSRRLGTRLLRTRGLGLRPRLLRRALLRTRSHC